MLHEARIIDLTLPYRDGMRGYSWETKYTVARDGWNARTLHLYTHAGTHMDAQVHFDAGPETIDQIPLERCCGTARLVRRPETRPGEPITVAHLGAVANALHAGEVLLVNTGWCRHVDTPHLYRDQLPPISEQLALWCVERGVKVLGVEPPSVANVLAREELTRIHTILLGGGVTIVEGLTNLDALPDSGAWFMAAPLKVEGADGSPCRAFALIT